MARRSSDDSFTALWELFTVAKWWMSPLVAALVFSCLYWALPALLETNPMLERVTAVPQTVAPWISSAILAIGIFALINRWMAGLLLDGQTGTDSIRNLCWKEFEELVGAAYRRQGYKVINTGNNGSDGGVDLVLQRDGERAVVQCKHWKSSKVGVRPVRELYGVARSKEYSGSRAVFITYGTYTAEAVRFARDNGVELIGNSGLIRMVHSARKSAVTESAEPSDPLCPECGRSMILRTARRGESAGRRFWGCSAYPTCRGVADC